MVGKHKPKCLFKGLQCSVAHSFQALSRCLFLPRAVLSFLHSIWAFPLYFSTSQPVELHNDVSIFRTSVSQSASSETITKSHQLPPRASLHHGAAGPCAADAVQGSAQALPNSRLTQTVVWWVVHSDIQWGLDYAPFIQERGAAVPKSPATFQTRHLQLGLWFSHFVSLIRLEDDNIPFSFKWFIYKFPQHSFRNECTDQKYLRRC